MLPNTHFKLFSNTQKLIKLFAVSSIALLVAGCATLDKSDCQKGDWAGIGYNDAVAGLRDKSQLQGHSKACSRYGVSPNNQSYFSGYARGLKQFCTREQGVQYGANRSEYYGVCPKPLERSFLPGYLAGIGLAIDNLEDEIDDMRHEQHKKSRKLRHLEKAKDGKKGDSKSVKKVKKDIDSLRSSISSKRSSRNELRSWYSAWSAELK